MHTCDNRICCNPSHLVAGTTRNNVRDCINKGRHKHGVVAKLTAQDVATIRFRLFMNEPQKSIAKAYDVSPGTISAINTGRSWKEE